MFPFLNLQCRSGLVYGLVGSSFGLDFQSHVLVSVAYQVLMLLQVQSSVTPLQRTLA